MQPGEKEELVLLKEAFALFGESVVAFTHGETLKFFQKLCKKYPEKAKLFNSIPSLKRDFEKFEKEDNKLIVALMFRFWGNHLFAEPYEDPPMCPTRIYDSFGKAAKRKCKVYFEALYDRKENKLKEELLQKGVDMSIFSNTILDDMGGTDRIQNMAITGYYVISRAIIKWIEEKEFEIVSHKGLYVEDRLNSLGGPGEISEQVSDFLRLPVRISSQQMELVTKIKQKLIQEVTWYMGY